jgi:hypothetical protein
MIYFVLIGQFMVYCVKSISKLHHVLRTAYALFCGRFMFNGTSPVLTCRTTPPRPSENLEQADRVKFNALAPRTRTQPKLTRNALMLGHR